MTSARIVIHAVVVSLACLLAGCHIRPPRQVDGGVHRFVTRRTDESEPQFISGPFRSPGLLLLPSRDARQARWQSRRSADAIREDIAVSKARLDTMVFGSAERAPVYFEHANLLAELAWTLEASALEHHTSDCGCYLERVEAMDAYGKFAIEYASHPRAAEARYYVALEHELANELDEADRRYRELVVGDSNEVRALALMGIAELNHLHMHRQEIAEAFYRNILVVPPSRVREDARKRLAELAENSGPVTYDFAD